MAIKNNELRAFDGSEVDLESEGMVNTKLDHRMIATLTGEAQMHVTDDQLSITNGANGLTVNERGTAICNPTHLAQDPSQLRVNTFWVVNDEIMTALPSTIYTPMPYLRYSQPKIAEQITDLARKLSGLGG